MSNYFNHALKMVFIPSSSNRKTGDLMQSYSSCSSCPTSCPFKGHGCYAAGGPAAIQWRRADNSNDKRFIANGGQLTAALTAAIADHARQDDEILFRHNVAGDMAIAGTSRLDADVVETITESCSEAQKVAKLLQVQFHPFTYTHCVPSVSNLSIMSKACQAGFTINQSCETVQEVVKAHAAHVPTVIASVNPEETIKQLAAVGIKAKQCKSQCTGDSCKKCKWCCQSKRDFTVIFAVHGNACKKAAAAINAKTGKQ